jgi:hypothetical protein
MVASSKPQRSVETVRTRDVRVGRWTAQLGGAWAIPAGTGPSVIARHERFDVTLSLIALPPGPQTKASELLHHCSAAASHGAIDVESGDVESGTAAADLLVALQHLINLRPTVHVCGRPQVRWEDGQLRGEASGWEENANPQPWWKRLLFRPSLHWHFWLVGENENRVFVSCAGSAEGLAKTNADVHHVLHTLHRDGHAMSRLTVANGLSISDGATYERMNRHHGVGESVATAGHAPAALSWEVARDLVMPQLVPTAALDTTAMSGVMRQTWVQGISIIYMIDGPAARRPVLFRDCATWNIDLETLHAAALENLNESSHALTMEGGKGDGYTMLAFPSADPYNAARILLPGLHARLRTHLGSSFMVAIPNQEFLLAFSIQNPAMEETLKAQIASDFHNRPHALSDQLFVMTADGIAGDAGDWADAATAI